jgi:hypothetical protein
VLVVVDGVVLVVVVVPTCKVCDVPPPGPTALMVTIGGSSVEQRSADPDPPNGPGPGCVGVGVIVTAVEFVVCQVT